MIKHLKGLEINSIYDFDNAFSINELLCKFWEKIEEAINISNESIDILNWVKEQGLPAEVQVLINQLVADGTIEQMINVDKITEITNKISNISSQLNNISSQVNNISVIMPLPSTVEENTTNLQKILDRAKDKNINLTVHFLGGYYELNTCIIYDNTTIKMTNNTILKNVKTKFNNNNISILFMNAKPYDNEDGNITGYYGRSNITVDGGILDSISAFCLCHGQNITIKNVTFMNCDSDHYIQIGGCKNVKIQNCKFIGTTERATDREYVEFIQIDWMTAIGQPYWISTANIFDSTVNDGIEIDGCEFETGTGEYNFMYTCVGSHSTDGVNKNKNIVIRNCKFTGYSYAALTIDKMSNVFIDNNVFTDTKNTCAITISNSDNVTVNSNNRIKGGKRGIFCSTSSNIKIDGVLIEEVNADSDFILIGESSNVELNKINFINCNTVGNNVLIRNCSDINADSCRDVNTTAADGHFFRVYTKSNGVSERIRIKNTITTNKKECRMSNTNTIIYSGQEELWSGNISSGEIPLNDDISKFKNLKITIDVYGKTVRNLDFVNNLATFKEFNLRDNTAESLRINFIEIQLTLDSANNKIIINHINQVDINNGVPEVVTSNVSICKITGERVYY